MIAAIYARKSIDQSIIDRGPRMGMALVSALVILLFIAPHGFAEEPTGFADLRWGTLRKDVIEKFIKAKCNWSESKSLVTDETIECAKYRLMKDWPPVNVKLSFGGGRLTGSYVEALWSYSECRLAVMSKFGPPRAVVDSVDPGKSYPHQPGPPWPKSRQRVYRESGEQWFASWQWPSGTSASLVEYYEFDPLSGKSESRTTVGVWTKVHGQSGERPQRGLQDRSRKVFSALSTCP